MARTTVEDCLAFIPNRYELVLIASKRARQIASGLAGEVSTEEENEKSTVIALREIGDGSISQDELIAIEEKANNTTVQMDFEGILRGFEEADRELEEKADLEKEEINSKATDDQEAI